MPNWCDNELIIKEAEEELERFKTFAEDKDEKLSANKFIPYPKEFKELDELCEKERDLKEKLIEELKGKGMTQKDAFMLADKKYPYRKDGFNSGGREWCIVNWGTKCGFCNVDRWIEKTKLLYTFDTAWSPPIPLIVKMGEMFPKLSFYLSYYEGGMGFQGKLVVDKGEVIKDFLKRNYTGHRGG